MRVAKAYGPPIANKTDETSEEDIGTGAGLFKAWKSLQIRDLHQEAEEKTEDVHQDANGKTKTWKGVQSKDVHQEDAGKIKTGKSLHIGDVHQEDAGETEAW